MLYSLLLIDVGCKFTMARAAHPDMRPKRPSAVSCEDFGYFRRGLGSSPFCGTCDAVLLHGRSLQMEQLWESLARPHELQGFALDFAKCQGSCWSVVYVYERIYAGRYE